METPPLTCPLTSIGRRRPLREWEKWTQKWPFLLSFLLSKSGSCISPEQLELQKSYLHLFASSFKELSDEIRIFQIRWQNQTIFAKTLFWQKKISYWKKSAILSNSKTFFHGSNAYELNLHTNHLLAQKLSRNLCKSR